MDEKKLKTVDLFCGCGGMSLGVQEAGFDLAAAFDNWKPALEVYKKNFIHKAHQADVADEAVIDIIAGYRPDVIVGGPPCQDFSTAGKMKEDGRAALTVTFAEIVTRVLPSYYIMENVAAAKRSEAYGKAVKLFKEAGYGLTQEVLDASYCGVPQVRKRCFVIGALGAEDDFLKKRLEEKLADKPLSIYEYLSDELGTEYYFRVPTNYSRRGVFSVYEPSVTVRGIDRPIPKGYKGHPNDPVEMGPKVKALSAKERSRLQTFPKEFIFEGGKSDLNQMIGNAVPVELAKYVGNALMDYIKETGGEEATMI